MGHRYRRVGRTLVLILILHVWTAAVTHAQDAADWRRKVDPALLEAASKAGGAAFLVRFAGQADLSGAARLRDKEEKGRYVFALLRAHAARVQSGAIDLLEAEGVAFRPFWIASLIHVEGGAEVVERLARRPEVAYLFPDPVMRAPRLDPSAAAAGKTGAVEWNIERVGADDVWALGITGAGVVVGGQDTGYDWDHPALRDRYRGWQDGAVGHDYNWHDAVHQIDPHNSGSNPCGLDLTAPCDDDGHGTHTMGTMVGADGANQIGMAPGARWIGCRNMERGWGLLSNYLECFQWFLAPTDLSGRNPDPSKAPHVINNSWYCPSEEGCNPSNWADLEAAVQALRAAGVVVVASAGNSGSAGCGSVSDPPALFAGSFSVGATNNTDDIAGFSSRGPVTVDGSGRRKPDVSAPGVSIRSSLPGGGYGNSSGTSMAGPHVAGLVALLISANPALAGDVEALEDLIERTAVPRAAATPCGGEAGGEVPNNTYGYGRIDALAAVDRALDLALPGTEDEAVPERYVLAPSYPNPFRGETTITFGLPEATDVRLVVYDLLGRAVVTLVQGRRGAGVHEVVWDGRDAGGRAVAGGVYLYRLETEGFSRTRRMVRFR